MHLAPHLMNSRITALWLFLLYSAAGVLLGLIPHGHHAGEVDGACAACVWQVNSGTDVPVVSVSVSEYTVMLVRTPSVVSVPVGFDFFEASASRAPPETTA